jgi:amidase
VDLTAATAQDLSAAIADRSVSCRDVMAAHLDRIEEQNPAVNAIVSLRDRDELMAEAAVADEDLVAGRWRGWMHGFPHAVKDLAETAGLRTTLGSPLFSEWVPTYDAVQVARIRAQGAIIIAKTNVPEFGLGSHTFNPVFGTPAMLSIPRGPRVVQAGEQPLRSPPAWCRSLTAATSWGR